MPHYKDGTEVKIGDIAKGKPYNTPHEVVGVVTGVLVLALLALAACAPAKADAPKPADTASPASESPLVQLRRAENELDRAAIDAQAEADAKIKPKRTALSAAAARFAADPASKVDGACFLPDLADPDVKACEGKRWTIIKGQIQRDQPKAVPAAAKGATP